MLKKETALKLAVEGHTDNVVKAKRNVTLSRERAQAVVDALIKDGIDSARLSAAGHGAGKPIGDNGSDEGRAKNRRVELVKFVKGSIAGTRGARWRTVRPAHAPAPGH